MKVVSSDGLTKLVQLIKSSFIPTSNVEEVTEIDTETTSEVDLATVATSGSYNDLSNQPTIPTTTSSVTSSSSAALTSGGAYTALQNYQTTANLVTSVSSSSTNSQYPSAKLFYDTCGDIETLINAL